LRRKGGKVRPKVPQSGREPARIGARTGRKENEGSRERKYWFGIWQDCAWTQGATWTLIFPDGRVADAGEVLEIDPPNRLVLKWRNEFRPELREEGFSRATFELEHLGDTVKLTVIHEIDRRAPNSSRRCRTAGRRYCPA